MGLAIALFQAFPLSSFHRLHYVKLEVEGLGDLVMCMTTGTQRVTWRRGGRGRGVSHPKMQNKRKREGEGERGRGT